MREPSRRVRRRRLYALLVVAWAALLSWGALAAASSTFMGRSSAAHRALRGSSAAARAVLDDAALRGACRELAPSETIHPASERSSVRGVPRSTDRVLLGSVAWSSFRPGGGHTYGGGSSGGGSGGSSSGSGDGADLIIWLIYLCIEAPEIGIPLVILILVVVGVGKAVERLRSRRSYSVGAPSTTIEPPRRSIQRPATGAPAAGSVPVVGAASVRRLLDGIRPFDPSFSMVLFEDFLYALYAATHEARGGDRLYDLSAYIDGAARQSLAARACRDVEGVVVGAMTYEKARIRSEAAGHYVDVKVRFESNYTETDATGRKQTYYAVEHWMLTRRRDAKTKPPELVQVLGCPNCGGPHERIAGNRCQYCGQTIRVGEFDWAVTHIDVETLETRPPQLTGDAPEVGTNDPTLIAPGAEQRYREILAHDHPAAWQRFQARVAVVFDELQRAWSTHEWLRARAYVSDQLFQMQLYWIETYERAGLRNITENARIESLTVADARSDAHYDAVVVRLFATGLDYTIDAKGKVVSGSKKRERRYSEYWTMIRGRGVQGGSQERVCPACGAPLAVNMAGQCTHCQAKLTTGRFDWVLSRIEQDESYRG